MIEKNKDYVQIEPEYVYLTIPARYVCTYHKLLVLMADFGKTIINDCNSICQNVNKHIYTCWHLFQSACAAYNLNKIKEADFFINYINNQIEHIYNGTLNEVYNGEFIVKLSEDGHLKAIVTCNGGDAEFYVDQETGHLIQTKFNDKYDFEIRDNKLVMIKK